MERLELFICMVYDVEERKEIGWHEGSFKYARMPSARIES